MRSITIPKPFNAHCHLRDDWRMPIAIKYTAAQYMGAVVMPNLVPHVTTVAMAQTYREKILPAIKQLKKGSNFIPWMTISLNDETSADEIKKAKDCPWIIGAKWYAGSTTNSDRATNLKKMYIVLGYMEKVGLPLLIHGELGDRSVDIYDLETRFIDEVLTDIRKEFPELKITLEHITTRRAVQFVTEMPKMGATITPQHLLGNRNMMFGWAQNPFYQNEVMKQGLRPHWWCLPILKGIEDQIALLKAVTSGNPKFFLGDDSAPHGKNDKESACGCAGCFSAPHSIELYAMAFYLIGKLDMLENFASVFGPKHYGMEVSTETLTLKKKPTTILREIFVSNGNILVPFGAGETLPWSVKN
jgi:dihydroorotase